MMNTVARSFFHPGFITLYWIALTCVAGRCAYLKEFLLLSVPDELDEFVV